MTHADNCGADHCARCGGHLQGTTRIAGTQCTCDYFVWPGTAEGHIIAIGRNLRDIWRMTAVDYYQRGRDWVSRTVRRWLP